MDWQGDSKNHPAFERLGLQPRMPYYDPGRFTTYVRPSYLNSPEYETDQIYRFSEIILIHRVSGVRVGCLREEDYFGEKVEYVIMSNFHVITSGGEKLEVLDIDLLSEKLTTQKGELAFSEISKEPER